MTHYKCPHCEHIEEWSFGLEENYCCANCGKSYFLPGQSLPIAKEVLKEKYPGAWGLHVNSDSVVADQKKIYIGSKEDTIKAVTGSRLLQYFMQRTEEECFYLMDVIKEILKSHKKMLEVVE